MTYREPAQRTRHEPRILVVYPLRVRATAAITIVSALILVVAPILLVGGGAAMLLVAAMPAIGLFVGMKAWTTKVRFAVYDGDDELTITWPRLLRIVARTVKLSDVTDVVVETSGAPRRPTRRLAIVVAGEHVPLTGTFVSSPLDAQAAELRRHLRVEARRAPPQAS